VRKKKRREQRKGNAHNKKREEKEVFKHKLAVAVSAAAVLLVAGAGFSSIIASASTKSTSTSTSSSKRLHITLVDGEVGIAFFDTLNCGAIAAGKAFNVAITTVGPSTMTVAAQTPVLQAASETHPNGIILAPDDPNGMIAPVKAVEKLGIPVATVDLSLSKHVEVANFRPNGTVLGKEAADQLGKALGGKGVVFIMGLVEDIVANQSRATGFIAEMKAKFPKVTILPEVFPGSSSSVAATDAAAALQAHRNISGIFTTDGIDATAAAAALKADHDTTVKIVAMDADPDEVAAIKNGTFYALAAQPPYLETYDAVRLLAQIARGQVKESSVNYEHFLPGLIITKANVNSAAAKKIEYVTSCP
jgi:ribose transport system substrate-binding protein